MVSSDQPVRAANHLIFMIFSAIQSCSTPLCLAGSSGAVLRAVRAETSATGQEAVHRPWALQVVDSCRFLEQWWEREDAARFEEGSWVGFASSKEFASLQANVPCKPFPQQIELLFYLA